MGKKAVRVREKNPLVLLLLLLLPSQQTTFSTLPSSHEYMQRRCAMMNCSNFDECGLRVRSSCFVGWNLCSYKTAVRFDQVCLALKERAFCACPDPLHLSLSHSLPYGWSGGGILLRVYTRFVNSKITAHQQDRSTNWFCDLLPK